jgi:hypothetical protein
MRRTWIVLALGASACAEPVIELSLTLPAMTAGGSFNTSCVTAIDMVTIGENYPNTDNDYVKTCIDVTTTPATFQDVKLAMQGKFDVAIPPSGLSGVEIFGRRGSCRTADDTLPPGDLVFYAGSPYVGGDSITLPVIAASSCDQAPVAIRLVDIVKLTTGAIKGDCTAAQGIDGPEAGATIGTLTPTIGNGIVWYAGFSGAALMGGVANVPMASTVVGPKSCLGVFSGDATSGSMSCVTPGAPTACAVGTELETAILDVPLAFDSIDPSKLTKFPGIVWGAIVNNMKQPIAGATVEIDPALGEVVYVEPSGVGAAMRLVPTGGATGPSGLFGVYTKGLVPIKATSGGLSRTITVGAVTDFPAATLIVLR